jgi:hypothetical protein
MVIKKFEAAPSSQRLPGCWRQPVTLARSLAAGGLHESRRARCSRSSRRPSFVRGFSRTARNTEQAVFRSWLLTNGPKHGARRIDETAEAIFHRVEIQQLPSPISTSPAETGFAQAGAASPRAPRTPRAPRFTDQCARANGAMFPENIHQTLTRAVIRIVTRHLGLYRPWPGMPANSHFPSGIADSDEHLGEMRTAAPATLRHTQGNHQDIENKDLVSRF